MLMISTGDAHAEQAAPGTVATDSGRQTDRADVEFELLPEQNASILYVSYNFMTTENPGFAAAGYNDSVTIEVQEPGSTRELASLDAASAALRPIAHGQDLDTGFALFSDDQSQFPANYGAGTPAAAMSGWQTAAVALKSDGPITIRVELRDAGDSLMDSAVVIGRIATTSFLDPRLLEEARGPDCVPPQKWCNTLFPVDSSAGPTQEFPPPACSLTEIPRSPTGLLDTARTVRGITQPGGVADGATRYPFGFFISNNDGPWNEAEISLPSMQVPEDGGLGQPGSFDRLPSVTVPVEQIGPRDWAATAQYFVPETYWYPGLTADDFGLSRPLVGQACFRNTSTGAELCVSNSNFPFAIARPQVVLMHGLWSAPDIWKENAIADDFPLINEQDVTAIFGNYSANDNNARSFEENRLRPQQPLRAACVSRCSTTPACTQPARTISATAWAACSDACTSNRHRSGRSAA